jgi:DNA-binding MarR family transcriptional regulator
MIIEDRLNNLKDERSVRLELTSQIRKELQTQFARIKQTIEKVLDGDTSLAEGINTIFREQGITIASILTAFALMISTIVGFATGGAGYNPAKNPEKRV